MMKKATILGLAVVLAMGTMATAAETLMTFEEFLGNDVAPIATYYSGISFQSGLGGSDWVARDASTGNYNVSSWPSGTVLGGGGEYWIYGNVGATTALDFTGNDGVIAFDNADATYLELGYSCNSELYLEAYNASDTLIDMDSGPANLRGINNNPNGPGTLRVDAPIDELISYVIVHDSGNGWVVDNIRTDATGIITNPIPAPGAILLASLGTGVLGWYRRRRAL